MRAIKLNVETPLERDSRGRLTVTPITTSAEALQAQAQAWKAEAEKITDSDLAKALGVSERHARRIKSGDVTPELLNRLGNKKA